MNPESFRIDVCPFGSEESHDGYPKHATDQTRAHLMAEDAVKELQVNGDPGEYLVSVSQDGNIPISSEVVVIPSTKLE